MEDIYTIKVRTTPNPSNLYPSERRYSASTVLGLGVVHLALGLTAFLLTLLTLIARNDQQNLEHNTQVMSGGTETGMPVHFTLQDIQNPDIARRIETFSRTNLYIGQTSSLNESSVAPDVVGGSVSTLTLASCLIAVVALAAGVTGILAWRRWYMDHNITMFCLCSILSTAVSFGCLITILVGVTHLSHIGGYYASNPPQQFVLKSVENDVEVGSIATNNDNTYDYNQRKNQSLRVVLAINIAIAAFLELIWSGLSARLAWRGMRNGYADDVNIRRGGNLQVNTVYQSNTNRQRQEIIPKPDIIAHYPKMGKIAKYFPKCEPPTSTNSDLPKEERHREYEDRVHRFLTSRVSDDDCC